ncbi:hypothetical protein LPJ64_005215 [Coemansia asiatica]|uniref:UBA domain-containing protein n=1 Tax=Coemansia asiatica TaxID=1052880 RepID=A0A9W7XHG1_9FUNG|nr:hypothetical protein LPJ64_005215 [Coemansia asiatica]
MEILSKASLAAGIAASVAKSTISYYVRGPKCASWPLWFQIKHDAIHSVVKKSAHRVVTDDEIDSIDFAEIAADNRKYDLPVSEIPPSMGSFERGIIDVSAVPIDTQAFAGTGPAEKELVSLTETDLSKSSSERRQIAFDIIVPTTLIVTAPSAFECKPLNSNEHIILYLHGGGYALGSAASHRGLTGRLAFQSNLRCVAIDYRLAPLHPYPAQLHDAFIALQYLVQQGFQPENIVLAGDSAGGNLVLALTMLLRHIGVPQLRGLVLFSPWPDLVSQRPSIRQNDKFDYLAAIPHESPLCQSRLFYAPGRPYSQELIAEMAHPLVSPINGDFKDFPPTLIQVGDKEMLFDDISELHHNMLAANPDRHGSFIYECYADMLHVFHQFLDLPAAQEAFISAGKFIKGL